MIERLAEAIGMIEVKQRGRNAAVARATRYSPAMISAVFSGDEPLSDKLLAAICSAYSINEDWVRTGFGPMFENKQTRIAGRLSQLGVDMAPVPPPSGLIPVVSMASANGDGPCWEDAYPVGHGMEQIWRPHDVDDPRAFGVKVDGDSMSPKYEDGDIVVVCPQKQVTSGMPVVAKLADGRVLIKRIRYINDHVLLESINPGYDPIFIKKDEIEFAYKIVWTKGG